MEIPARTERDIAFRPLAQRASRSALVSAFTPTPGTRRGYDSAQKGPIPAAVSSYPALMSRRQ